MVIPNAMLLVAPPSRVPLPYGLLSVVQTPTEVDAHWQMGIEYEVDPCERARIFNEVCGQEPVDKEDTAVHELRCSTPFTVYTKPTCSTVGFVDRAERTAVAALTSGEARTVEREFWTGEFGTLPHLAADEAIATGADACVNQTAAVTVSGSPLSVVDGLALLEEQLSACYGNEGVVHMTPGTLTKLKGEHAAIDRDGQRLRTPNGHLVAAGAGYPGTAPDGSEPAPGVRWMYATGAVFMLRSTISTKSTQARETVDRAKNNVFVIAERTYVLGWDCCHFAVPVRIATAG